MSYPSGRLQLCEVLHSPSLDRLTGFLHESIGPGVVRVLGSEAKEPLSCVCSVYPLETLPSDDIPSATLEINPVPSCPLLSQGVWSILCQRGIAPPTRGETLCVAASVEGVGSLAIQAEVLHFARQDFRYRRFCCRTLYLSLLSVISLLESQRALERAREREEQVRHLVHANALAREGERERLSLQLHDGVIQSMVSAFHMVEAIREMDTYQPEHSAILQRAEEVLSQAIKELRGVINALHTATSGPEMHNR